MKIVDFGFVRGIGLQNLDGLFLMCRASSDLMRQRNYGRIVNICSNSIFAGTPNMAHYVASKGGVPADPSVQTPRQGNSRSVFEVR